MRTVKITKEQYDRALSEGITLQADVAGANGDVKKAVDTTKQQAERSGVNLDNAKIQINANENRIIPKKDMNVQRMKVLKEHSTRYTVRDFIKVVKNK